MKSLLRIALLLLIFQACTTNKSVIELEPQQNMVIAGKGPGQDGAINPYHGEKCIAIVKNVGPSALNVRIQQKGEILRIVELQANEIKEFTLEIGHELYFDTDGATKTVVRFKPFKE